MKSLNSVAFLRTLPKKNNPKHRTYKGYFHLLLCNLANTLWYPLVICVSETKRGSYQKRLAQGEGIFSISPPNFVYSFIYEKLVVSMTTLPFCSCVFLGGVPFSMGKLQKQK